MNAGDKLTLKEDIKVVHMFPPKGEDPKENVVKAGSIATVETAWKSGAGIVKFENGLRTMVMDLSGRFNVEGKEE